VYVSKSQAQRSRGSILLGSILSICGGKKSKYSGSCKMSLTSYLNSITSFTWVSPSRVQCTISHCLSQRRCNVAKASLIIFDVICCAQRRSGWILVESSFGKNPCHKFRIAKLESLEHSLQSSGDGISGEPIINPRSSSITCSLSSSYRQLLQKASIIESRKEANILQLQVRICPVSDSTSVLQYQHRLEGQRPCCHILFSIPAKLQNDLLA